MYKLIKKSSKLDREELMRTVLAAFNSHRPYLGSMWC